MGTENMNSLLKVWYLALIGIAGVLLSSCIKQKINSSKKLIRVHDSSLEYFEYMASVPGRFFFGLVESSKNSNRHQATSGELLVVNTEGKVLFDRSFHHGYGIFGFGDFKPITPLHYGYFLARLSEVGNWNGTYHFLDRNFHDAIPRPVPNYDPDLDYHEATPGKNGNIFFLFTRPLLGRYGYDMEIQEWDPSGKKIFTWSIDERLDPSTKMNSRFDGLHGNSIEVDSDGNLLVSFRTTSEVFKIEYPSGKILWRMSAKSWIFRNDPFLGFHSQHSVRRLPSGNILMMDNGRINVEKAARAAEFRIDEAKRTAELVWEYRQDSHYPYRPYAGSVQRLSNGNTLIGWGTLPFGYPYKPESRIPLFTEVNSRGEKVREMMTERDLTSYRIYFEEDGG